MAIGIETTTPEQALGFTDEPPVHSTARIVAHRLRHDRLAMVCLGIVAAFVLVALCAPLLAHLEGQDPFRTDADLVGDDTYPIIGTTPQHWFGVEPRLGRDLFARWAYGARPALALGVVVTALSTVIGTAAGLVAGYCGGVVDAVVGWVVDVLLSLPMILFILAVVPVAQTWFVGTRTLDSQELSAVRFWIIVGVLVVFGWAGLARLVRGEVVALREREFVQAARVVGVSTPAILVREILPNLVGPIVVSASMMVPAAVTSEATLDFLGAGLVEPTPSWGLTIAKAQDSFARYPLFLWPPVISMAVLVLALVLLGDAVRDAFDPSTDRSGRLHHPEEPA